MQAARYNFNLGKSHTVSRLKIWKRCMNDPVEILAQRHPEYMSREKRSLLRYVFDTVCKEAGIFANATEERIELAARILETAKTIDSEYFLIAAGHDAIAEIRARKRFGSR